MKIKVNDVCNIAQNTTGWRLFTIWNTINSRRGNQEVGLLELTSCGLAGSEQRFGGTYWLHLQCGSHILEKDCVRSNSLANLYQTTRRKIREDDSLHFCINILWQSVAMHVNYLNFRVISTVKSVIGNGWQMDWLRSDRITRCRNVWVKLFYKVGWGGGGMDWIDLAQDRDG